MANEVPTKDFTWQQGEDGQISLIYKMGEPPVVVNLTGWSVRMDVRLPDGVATLFTFNSNDANPATGDEVTLGSAGQINIVVDRAVTLTGGELFDYIGMALNYDIFLRDTASKQKKILKGTVTVEESETLWA